jgi:hypothetical protein
LEAHDNPEIREGINIMDGIGIDRGITGNTASGEKSKGYSLTVGVVLLGSSDEEKARNEEESGKEGHRREGLMEEDSTG